MKHRTAYRLACILISVVASACNEPILTVGPDNAPKLTNVPDSFQYQAFDLQNVHDTLTWQWTVTGPVAVVTHQSFIPHGTAVLSIRDADGTEVYHNPLQSPETGPIEKDTAAGRPGSWTIQLQLYGIDGGRLDFTVTRKEQEPAPK